MIDFTDKQQKEFIKLGNLYLDLVKAQYDIHHKMNDISKTFNQRYEEAFDICYITKSDYNLFLKWKELINNYDNN